MSARTFGMGPKLGMRKGGTLVEFAIIAPAMFMLLFGIIIGGGGVFRYQQIAYLSREASRYASVHGSAYAAETGKPAADSAAIYNQVIVPKAKSLDLSKLSMRPVWPNGKGQYHTVVVNGNAVQIANTVSVTVSYTWIPEGYVGQKTMTSTSVFVMSF